MKKIIRLLPGQEVPPNAKFLYVREEFLGKTRIREHQGIFITTTETIRELEPVFYYEVESA